MTIKFKDMTMHGRERLLPGHAYAFADEGAEAYFKAAFGAEDTKDEPEYTFPEGSIEIDPDTVHHESGLLVSDIVKHGSIEKATSAGVARAGTPGELAPDDVPIKSKAN